MLLSELNEYKQIKHDIKYTCSYITLNTGCEALCIPTLWLWLAVSFYHIDPVDYNIKTTRWYKCILQPTI